MQVKITWQNKPGRMTDGGANCYVGPYRVACTSLNGNGATWYGVSFLPSINIVESMNRFTSEDDARKVVELVVRKWFDRIGPSLSLED